MYLLVVAVWMLGAVLSGPYRAHGVEVEVDKIRISYSSQGTSAMPFQIAFEKGFFREEGLEVQLIQVSPRIAGTAVMNGDLAFTSSFLTTFRGIIQGLPLKVILIALKRGIYFLAVRSEIKDVQDLKGKKIAVATVKGTDQLVGEELLRSKGFDPALVQFVAVGEAGLRAQALTAGAVDATVVSSPHYMYLERAGFRLLAGPPEVGFPAAGLITSTRLLQENPQMAKRTLRAILKAHRFIFENRQETLQIMTRLRQPPDIAAQSYEQELLTLSKDGEMTDPEMERLIERIADKKRPLSEVRDFSLVRQARNELDGGK